METLIIVIAFVLAIIGIVGSIVPGLPGVPFSWLAFLVLYIWGNGQAEGMTWWTLVIWGIVVAVVTIIDYYVPMYFTKVTGGSKHAERGALVGMLVGMFVPIPYVNAFTALILGPFVGAFLFELIGSKQGFGHSLKAAAGSFLGFLLGTGLKVVVSVWMFVLVFKFAF